MDVEFQLQPEDLQAFLRYHRQLTGEPALPIPRWIWGVVLVGSVGFRLYAPDLGIGHSQIDAFFLGFGVAWVGSMLLVFRTYRIAIRRQQFWFTDERNRYSYEVKHFTLSPEGITETGSQSVSTNRWPRLWHIGRTLEHAFFFISLDAAFIVPRRAFQDEQDFGEFVVLARKYQRESDRAPPRPTGILAGLPPQSDAIRPQQDTP